MTIPETQLRAAFADMVREKLPLYRSISVRIVNSQADADDAVQSALLKGWKKRAAFRGDLAALSGWVARIVVTESYDLLRRRRNDGRIMAQFEPDDGASPYDDDLKMLDEAIEKLPELYRETVHLALLGPLSANDAAKMLDCSANTLYQRIYKAKKLLKQHLRSRKND